MGPSCIHKPRVLLAAGASENVLLAGASEKVRLSSELCGTSSNCLGGDLDFDLLRRLGDLLRRLGDLERRLGERDRRRGDRDRLLGDRLLGDRLLDLRLLGLRERERERRDLLCASSNCLISS